MVIPSAVIVIFGASGDLAARKLLPALFELYKRGAIDQKFAVLGVGRTKLSRDAFRDKARLCIVNSDSEGLLSNVDKSLLDEFVARLHYCAFNTLETESYAVLPDELSKITAESDIEPNYLFYLATPPSLYTIVVNSLAANNLTSEDSSQGWRRLVVEKPFGKDLISAIELNKQLLRHFKEEQIFRIDHYLGKETVQNILVTRLANGLFEPLWNHKHIHHVEITVAENLGIGERAGYFDGLGTLRDMIQNHILQLLGYVAIEPPTSMDGESIRKEMLRMFQSIRGLSATEVAENFVRGQYVSGDVDGNEVCGYLEEDEVADGSNTETYVAAKLFLDNERWRGVPFFLRSGKRLAAKVSEVVIHFKPTCGNVLNKRVAFSDVSKYIVCDSCNQLILRIEPDEGLSLRIGMKTPGAEFKAQSVDMLFRYSSLGEIRMQSAYERLLLEVLQGETMLFPQGDSIIRCWEIIEPVRSFWQSQKSNNLFHYKAGSWGPWEAEKLIENKEMMWRYPNPSLEGRGN